MSENAKIIEKFISDKNNSIIFGINIDEKLSIFYQYFIKIILSKNKISLKKFDDLNDINQKSINLFDTDEVLYISFKKIKHEGKEKLINFLPYRDVKKYMNNGLINSYQIDKDIMFILKNNELDNENELFEYLKLNPHLIEKEIEKILINKKRFVFDNSYTAHEDIYSIRMEILKIKKASLNLKKLYDQIKKEAFLKKFNFLVY